MSSIKPQLKIDPQFLRSKGPRHAVTPLRIGKNFEFLHKFTNFIFSAEYHRDADIAR